MHRPLAPLAAAHTPSRESESLTRNVMTRTPHTTHLADIRTPHGGDGAAQSPAAQSTAHAQCLPMSMTGGAGRAALAWPRHGCIIAASHAAAHPPAPATMLHTGCTTALGTHKTDHTPAYMRPQRCRSGGRTRCLAAASRLAHSAPRHAPSVRRAATRPSRAHTRDGERRPSEAAIHHARAKHHRCRPRPPIRTRQSHAHPRAVTK